MVQVLFYIAAVLFPFVAMPLLWRRMKRVRNGAHHGRKPEPQQEPWQETVETRDGLNVVRAHDPNKALIELGERGHHASWPLSNP